MSIDSSKTEISEPKQSYPISATLFGPFKLSKELKDRFYQERQSEIQSSGSETYLTVSNYHTDGSFELQFIVSAISPHIAKRVGAVYVSEFSDLLSAVIECPIEEGNDSPHILNREILKLEDIRLDQVITLEKWNWLAKSFMFVRKSHPRYLTACGWYRKALVGEAPLENFCCFWRTIERIAESYVKKSVWSEDETSLQKIIAHLNKDLFQKVSPPEFLTNPEVVSKTIQLRNIISRGNLPLSIDMIETAHDYLEPLQNAAQAVLREYGKQKVRSNSEE